ncbi:Elongation factor Ts [Mesomycoplasma conjunctivae]|uniref:Elongation factor Ts n=1 Tax=Mesomycoplasma conjunctivae (strain ATCC 25834 / NCTC 10147 / HRC/581) TaxID=572263 RepID=C5J5S0_MESCH|nr:translation elongation factor Ts [Mesomycoplasma conjunctivae]CAT04806.1 Elongation factor Ts [Mesomycoplasma conjunctivae]VEU65835.1 Elongation factor Ts [Mesomycoplasma conjunctivae]
MVKKEEILLKIKKLREISDAPFVDCKQALENTDYDLDKAVVWLQENGKAKALKKANRIAAEGLVSAIKNEENIVIFELNSETDFVAKNQNFIDLKNTIATTLLEQPFDSFEQALQVKTKSGKTISELVTDATATIGEKINLRRAIKTNISAGENAGLYVHSNGQIATITIIKGGSEEVAKNISMHTAALNPDYIFESDVPAEKMSKIQQEFASSKVLEGKPENIKANILKGMISKELSKFVLEYQDFAMDSAISVSKYLQNNGAKLIKVVRFEVGEGIEKETVDFSQEVQAQIAKAKQN